MDIAQETLASYDKLLADQKITSEVYKTLADPLKQKIQDLEKAIAEDEIDSDLS